MVTKVYDDGKQENKQKGFVLRLHCKQSNAVVSVKIL